MAEYDEKYDKNTTTALIVVCLFIIVLLGATFYNWYNKDAIAATKAEKELDEAKESFYKTQYEYEKTMRDIDNYKRTTEAIKNAK